MSDDKTPIPIVVRKNQERRIRDLEKGEGAITRELGKLWDSVNSLGTRMGWLEKRPVPAIQPSELRTTDSDRPSQANLSFHPNRARVTLKNFPAWSVVLIFFLVILSLTAMTITVWLVTSRH